jgi:aurora kinase
MIKHLGEGRFGAVSMAIHKKSGLLVALKRVKKSVIKAHKLENQFVMEMKMQLFFKHPNILKLYGYFHDEESIYLILEFMEEGTLFSKLKKAKRFN